MYVRLWFSQCCVVCVCVCPLVCGIAFHSLISFRLVCIWFSVRWPRVFTFIAHSPSSLSLSTLYRLLPRSTTINPPTNQPTTQQPHSPMLQYPRARNRDCTIDETCKSCVTCCRFAVGLYESALHTEHTYSHTDR